MLKQPDVCFVVTDLEVVVEFRCESKTKANSPNYPADPDLKLAIAEFCLAVSKLIVRGKFLPKKEKKKKKKKGSTKKEKE